MHQSYLYAGDLLGGMSHPEERFEQVVERAGELHPWIMMPAVIIPPVLLEYSLPNRPMRIVDPDSHPGPVTLPRVVVIADLRSHRPARDDKECFSSLVVIWFRELFGDVPAEIQKQIAELDWDRLAFDWTP